MELEVLKDAIVSVLKVYNGEINGNTTFTGDLGADSLDVYQIVMYVEEKLDISLEKEDILQVRTVDEAVELIKRAEKA
ncbi:MAG: acyl carrier protein [Lachnospiraceae bacterium]|jgi:Acyl carrier protein|nr:acyl carrier protein [Lachnospiraceae bacterium]MBR3636776.1 acyl carrier protein [Lachnospiraceae bacterium]